MRSKSRNSSLRNIKLVLEYDGSPFFGFQRQKDKPTVQGSVEKALSTLFNRPLKIGAAAGRTDAGVHAKAQILHFKTDSNLPLGKIQTALNALLPEEIAVKRAQEMPLDFHARYGARSKTYEYVILNSRVRSPLLNGKVYQYPHSLDLAGMRKAGRMLLGRQNFKVFHASGSGRKSSIRSIRRFRIEKEGDQIRFIVEADGFLYHMVRSIVGTLLEVGRGRLSPKDFAGVLKKRDRSLAGITVPARGLTLVSVKY